MLNRLENQEAIDSLQAMLEQSCNEFSFCLCLVSKNRNLRSKLNLLDGRRNDGAYSYFKRNLLLFIKHLKKSIVDNDIEFPSYNPGSKLEETEYEVIKTDYDKNILEQVSAIDNFEQFPPFDKNDDFIDGLQYYVIVVNAIVNRVPKRMLFFRAFGAKKELGRSKLLALTQKGDSYDKAKEQIFLFDDKIDCFVFEDYCYIVNKGNFQQIFNFYSELETQAHNVLTKIKEAVPIANFDLFEEDCMRNNMKLTKLVNLSYHNSFMELKIEDIKSVIDKYKLPLEILINENKEMIKYEKKSKWAILKILDDDYVVSLLTNRPYESNSKRPMK